MDSATLSSSKGACDGGANVRSGRTTPIIMPTATLPAMTVDWVYVYCIPTFF